MTHLKLILNPYANRWSAQAKVPAIEQALSDAGLTYELSLTTERGAGVALAREAAGKFDAVVAAGGDGTISEVINGLVQAAGREEVTSPLGILPIGTGNDFSDMAGLSREINTAIEVIATGKTRQVDLARANDHIFNNNCALAMEPLVTVENEKIKRLSGHLRYGLAVLKSLVKLQAWQMRVTWHDGEYEGPIYLLSVCNGPRVGSMFMMAPDAKIDDGLLDIIMVPEVSKATVLALLPKLITGAHLKHPKVQLLRSSYIKIQSVPGTPVHADGELVTESVTDIEYQILPGKLTLITP